jgi:ADP-dependent NAD(P)H-hydrate dehydratase / NAD(P)H-hydrate epimerase
MKLYTSKIARSIDAYAIKELGMPSLVLMEHASRGLYEEIAIRFWPLYDKEFVILCGNGNNGADGLCVSRLLALDGARVDVFLLNGEPVTKDGKTELKILKKTIPNINIYGVKKINELKKIIKRHTIVIDAVYGTGFNSNKGLSKQILSAFELCKKADFKIALDVPSGLDVDTGEVTQGALNCNITVTFAVPKVGLYTAPGAVHAGQVAIKSLFCGMPKIDSQYELLTERKAKELVHPLKRTLNSHKGRYGHLAVIAPQEGMEGAVAMSIMAALRSGLGLVSVVCINGTATELRKRMSMLTAEAMIKNIDQIDSSFKDFDAVLIGPGYGTKRKEELKELLDKIRIPIIIDADAINIISGDAKLISKIKNRKDVLLTPHPGEMARLCKTSSDAIQSKRLRMLEDFCKDKKFSLLLKGYRSLLYADKNNILVNSTGGPALAKGGSGDVLSGIIASFVAQGLKPYQAGALGMFVHGACADTLLEEKGVSELSMLPTDVISKLGDVISWLIES